MSDEALPVDAERERLTQLAEDVAALREALAAHEQHQAAALAAVHAELAAWRRRAAAQERRTVALQLLLRQAQQGTASSARPSEPAAPAGSAWQRWRDSRRGLGASLTLTGLVAGISGVLLHLALRHQVIDTTVHLGYLIGLSGLLLFLLGLLIVF
jgi:hypothetical protein